MNLPLSLSNKDRSYMEMAIQEAFNADRFFRARHGAVLIKGGSLISRGYNKNSHCSFGGRFRNLFVKGEPTLHAELACVLGISRGKTSGATIYVVRLDKDDHLRMSKPCPMCMAALRFVGVNKVVFTTNDGVDIIRI
jgi:tRNA(Arg) A34 adenosine deaminase TadA